MRLEFIDAPDMSEVIPFTEKYILAIKKKIDSLGDLDIKKVRLEKADPQKAERQSRAACLKLNLIWDENELELLILLLTWSETISTSINEEGLIFYKDSTKFELYDCACARLHFIKRATELVFNALNNLIIGTKDIGEVTYKMMLVSKFSYAYCSDLMNQLTNSLVSAPGLNAKPKDKKTH